MYELARNPRTQTRLQQEVDSSFPDKLPTFEDIKKLHYCHAVINETLRLHPPKPVVTTLLLLQSFYYKYNSFSIIYSSLD